MRGISLSVQARPFVASINSAADLTTIVAQKTPYLHLSDERVLPIEPAEMKFRSLARTAPGQGQRRFDRAPSRSNSATQRSGPQTLSVC
jgi:hypothetical protein